MPSTETRVLDGLSTSTAVKAPCRALATSNITLAGLQTIGSVTVVEDDRVLCVGQTDPVENGIYNASSGDWTRAKDADGNRDLRQGTRVLVRGTSFAVEYELTTANPITVGTSSLTFVLRYGANAAWAQNAAEVAVSFSPTDTGYMWGDPRRKGEAVDDDTDQTTDIVSFLGSLGNNYTGEINIPARMRFDTATVLAALPNKAVCRFFNTHQSGSGYRQQIVGVMSKPADDGTDTTFMILDPHYAAMSFNNPRTMATSSSVAGLAGPSWDRGFFTRGTKGPRVQQQINWTKSTVRTTEFSNKGIAAFTISFRAPERAENFEAWATGWAVTAGQYAIASNRFFYRATTSGTTGVTEPTHSTGSVSDGGVTWAFESGKSGATLFYVDEDSRIGTRPCDTGITHNWEQGTEDTEDFVIRHLGNATVNRKVYFSVIPRDGAGAASTVMPLWEWAHATGLRLLGPLLAREFIACTATQMTLSNTKFVSVTAVALAAVGNAINTTDKFEGKVIRESTNRRLYVARGSAAADPWDLADGTAAVTPS